VTPTTHGPSRLARFDALYTEHQRAVLAYAMRRIGDVADAEDVAAETFTIAWKKLESVPAEALPWLYAVARRVLANHRRGLSRRERLAGVLRVADLPTPLQVGDDVDGPAFQALASLSPGDQEILRLVAWEDLRNPQIAEVLGISVNAVAIRLHRARQRFAAALDRTDAPREVKYPGRSRTEAEVTGTPSATGKGTDA
jgi:RNA polymerase sigma-70 factor (ECF subfamily)